MKRAIALAAAGALAAGLALAPTAASANPVPEQNTETVTAVGDGSHGFLSRQVVSQGALRLRLRDYEIPSRDKGVQLTVVRVHRGFNIFQVLHAIDLQLDEHASPHQAALSTRLIQREAVAYGGIDQLAHRREVVSTTVHLDRPGAYWVVNTANGRAQILGRFFANHRFAATSPRDRHPDFTLVAGFHGIDRFFGGNGLLPRSGTFRAVNLGDDNMLHLVEIYKVRNGVTDADVQHEFDQILAGHRPTSDPAHLESTPRDEIGVDAISAGHYAEQRYRLDEGGTYLVVCFVADEDTGIPHLFTGMHKILHVA